jgi:hypothetical protein
MTRAAAVLFAAFLACPVAAQTKGEARRAPSPLPLPVSLEEMPAPTRDALSRVMKAPTVTAVCPAQEFVAHPDMYQWLLDHPDRAAAAWRKLGVEAVEIKTLKDGRFFWKDPDGSELVWQTVAQGPGGRVWYAEGQVKPGPLLPTIPVKAVAVLTHEERARPTGDSVIRQQIEVFLHTDSKAAALITRLIGDSAPRMAEQGAGQLLMFFSGIARYAHDKPERARSLLSDGKK